MPLERSEKGMEFMMDKEWNIESELELEQQRENEHIFYEVFEEHTEEEIEQYKRMAGIPFTN